MLIVRAEFGTSDTGLEERWYDGSPVGRTNSSFPSECSSSVSVLLRFRTEGTSSPSTGRFLQERRRVPGRLSGPRRFGTASYSHWLERRAQLSHPGLVESQRIFRARLQGVTPLGGRRIRPAWVRTTAYRLRRRLRCCVWGVAPSHYFQRIWGLAASP